jgi:uncharacterized protein YkwD
MALTRTLRIVALSLVGVVLLGSAAAGQSPPRAAKLDPIDQQLLDLHNAERRAVGAPPLRWNSALKASALAYASQLAKLGRLVHAPRTGRGERENLLQGLPGWDAARLVQGWIDEKRHFRPGTYPNVCGNDWSQCAHYTQMIWPGTTDVGCGIVQSGGYQWLVCRYTPGGNRNGQWVGRRR